MPKLYHANVSPPARGARMAAKAIGLTLTLQEVDLMNKAHLEPEFLKMNPTHTVPTLDDNGFFVFDSHAIAIYLAEKYGKDDSLYPRDVKKRAIVNQMLCLDNGTLLARLRTIVRSIIFGNTTEIGEEQRKDVIEAYGFLETFLGQRKWLAGDVVTIADTSIMATVSSFNVLIPIEESTHPKLMQWFKACKAKDWYSENVKGLEILEGIMKQKRVSS